MLQTLRVRNLAVVEQVRVDFEPGLNVITGETGAGKSVIAGALGLVLGERADRNLIRAGEDQGGAEAVFELAEAISVNAALDEMGLPPCEQGRLVIRRLITTNGAGRILVNDSPATVQALKRLGEALVDLHGPHDHQSLLRPDFQMELLDAFGGHTDERGRYTEAHREWLDLDARRRELEAGREGAGAGDLAGELDYLRHQIKEIETADLSEGDEETLRVEHNQAANAQRIMELADGITHALNDDAASAFAALATAQHALAELGELLPEALEWRQEAGALAVRLQELATDVTQRIERIETDPERLRWLDDRLALIHKLKRKYGATVGDILAACARARERLVEMETRGERLATLRAALDRAESRRQSAGEALRARRRQSATRLAKAVSAELSDLGFPHGRVGIALTDAAAPRPNGLDEIEFGFLPNPGEPERPLRAIASSGEISRVMLAIKAVLTAHDRIPVLVFDEIDANVGGEMGFAIGAKLARVAEHRQVLCITHLPQVAVRGRAHFVVTKQVRERRTYTEITPVTAQSRVEEVARMLGGRDSTSVALRHARELLESATERPTPNRRSAR